MSGTDGAVSAEAKDMEYFWGQSTSEPCQERKYDLLTGDLELTGYYHQNASASVYAITSTASGAPLVETYRYDERGMQTVFGGENVAAIMAYGNSVMWKARIYDEEVTAAIDGLSLCSVGTDTCDVELGAALARIVSDPYSVGEPRLRLRRGYDDIGVGEWRSLSSGSGTVDYSQWRDTDSRRGGSRRFRCPPPRKPPSPTPGPPARQIEQALGQVKSGWFLGDPILPSEAAHTKSEQGASTSELEPWSGESVTPPVCPPTPAPPGRRPPPRYDPPKDDSVPETCKHGYQVDACQLCDEEDYRKKVVRVQPYSVRTRDGGTRRFSTRAEAEKFVDDEARDEAERRARLAIAGAKSADQLLLEALAMLFVINGDDPMQGCLSRIAVSLSVGMIGGAMGGALEAAGMSPLGAWVGVTAFEFSASNGLENVLNTQPQSFFGVDSSDFGMPRGRDFLDSFASLGAAGRAVDGLSRLR